MNLMFVIDGKLITPPNSDSILEGITRDSLLVIARDMGVKVEERPVALAEIIEAFKNNSITEAYAVGTAAVASPIDTIGIDGIDYKLSANGNGVIEGMKKRLDDLRYGGVEDVYGWNTVVG